MRLPAGADSHLKARMADDIYLRTPIVDDTDEHILLNALGGRLVVRGLIDRKINNRFGDSIDAALAEAVLPIRVMLNALSGDGRPPPPYREAKGPDGTPYNLLPGGTPELANPSLSVKHENGSLQIEGVVRSTAELKRLLQRPLAKHGIPFERVAELQREQKERSPVLSMNLNFSPESTRSIAKMACNLFAKTQRAEFTTPGFDAIRSFIANGDGAPGDFVCCNTRPVNISKHGRALGLLDHLIFVRADGTHVEGLVALYEHLQFIVRLGRLDRPLRMSTAYRVDQIGAAHRVDDRRDMRLFPRSFDRVASSSWRQVLHEYHRAFSRLLRVVWDRHHAEFRRDLIETAMREAWGEPDGRPITQAMIERFARLVAERWTDHLVRSGSLRME